MGGLARFVPRLRNLTVAPHLGLVEYLFSARLDVYGWPESRCRYPRWLLDRDWRDLSGRHYYVIESGGTAITTSYKSADDSVLLQSSYHCLTSQPLNDSQHEGFIALVHVLDHW